MPATILSPPPQPTALSNGDETSSVSALLSTITTSTTSALASLPSPSPSSDEINTLLHPPENGLTLLDAKTELFLSYLQTLALRNLHVIRTLKNAAAATTTTSITSTTTSATPSAGDGEEIQDPQVAAAKAQRIDDALTKKLVELRVYLERGVRGLEGKIAYSVAKVLRAAEEEEGQQQQQRKRGSRKENEKNGKTQGSDEEEGSNNDEEDGSGSDDESSDEDSGPAISAHRANAANFLRPNHHDTNSQRRHNKNHSTADGSETATGGGGIYRPPRISATTMPSTSSAADRQRRLDKLEQRRPNRSATLDEYVRNELSTAPTAEPSIGSTITAGGRKTKDSRQLAREHERRSYEETNFVRLPKESKKERAKFAARERGRDSSGGFGGEEWRGLGQSLDRIGDLTRRKDSHMRNSGSTAVLDRSRKRRRDDDSAGGGGVVGQAFEEKKRRLTARRERRGR